jgi:hypothetical protein
MTPTIGKIAHPIIFDEAGRLIEKGNIIGLRKELGMDSAPIQNQHDYRVLMTVAREGLRDAERLYQKTTRGRARDAS